MRIEENAEWLQRWGQAVVAAALADADIITSHREKMVQISKVCCSAWMCVAVCCSVLLCVVVFSILVCCSGGGGVGGCGHYYLTS